MGYKTASQNRQRWTSTPRIKGVKKKGAKPQEPLKVDFGKPLSASIDAIATIVISCERCAKTTIFSTQDLLVDYDYETPFHIIYSKLTKKYSCEACGSQKHRMKINTLKPGTKEYFEIKKAQDQEYEREAQEKAAMNREREIKSYNGQVVKRRKAKNDS